MGKLMRIGFGVALLAVIGFLQAPTQAVALTCRQECFNTYKACRTACNGDEDCITNCQDQYEYCQCGACGYCP